MPSEREVAAMELGHPVNALPDCEGAIFFADLIDALRDHQNCHNACSDLECLMTAEIPGISDDGMKQLVDLVDASIRYVIHVNDELDAGRMLYRELSGVQ